MVGADGAPPFLLTWTNKPVETVGYDEKYLLSREVRIIRLFGKFEVIDSRIMIKLWLKGSNSLNEYLSKLLIPY